MDLKEIFKKKNKSKARHIDGQLMERKQLNMFVDARLKEYLQRLAVKFSVPRDIVGEHVLETGCFYVERSLGNEEIAKTVRQHLIDVHQLNGGIDDTETILRIGEGGNIAKLLAQVEPVRQSWRAFQHAVALANRTGKLGNIDKCEKQLLRSAVSLAMWLENNPTDDLGDA